MKVQTVKSEKDLRVSPLQNVPGNGGSPLLKEEISEKKRVFLFFNGGLRVEDTIVGSVSV